MKIARVAAFAAGLMTAHALTPARAQATPIQFGSNYYEFVQVVVDFSSQAEFDNNTWAAASAAAAASLFGGVNGHLATVTTSAENSFLFGLVDPANFPGFKGAWLGGKSPEGWLVGPESGQAFTFTNWGTGEPNNAGLAYMHIGSTIAGGGIAPGQWADDSGTQGTPDTTADPVIGYFVEYERPTVAAEPEVALMVLVGVLCVVAVRVLRS